MLRVLLAIVLLASPAAAADHTPAKAKSAVPLASLTATVPLPGVILFDASGSVGGTIQWSQDPADLFLMIGQNGTSAVGIALNPTDAYATVVVTVIGSGDSDGQVATAVKTVPLPALPPAPPTPGPTPGPTPPPTPTPTPTPVVPTAKTLGASLVLDVQNQGSLSTEQQALLNGRAFWFSALKGNVDFNDMSSEKGSKLLGWADKASPALSSAPFVIWVDQSVKDASGNVSVIYVTAVPANEAAASALIQQLQAPAGK